MINGLKKKKEKGKELTSKQCLSDIPKAPGVWIINYGNIIQSQNHKLSRFSL